MSGEVVRRMRVRSDSAADWSSANTTLGVGEIGYDETNDKVKIGDGATAWNSLAFAHYKPSEVDALIAQDIVKSTTIAQASANSGGTWGPRDGAILVFLQGSAFMIGGWAGASYDSDWQSNGGGVTTNQIYRTDNLGQTWELVKSHDTTPDPQHLPMVHTPAWCMHRVEDVEFAYICAGDAFVPFSDVYRSSNGTTWEKVNTSPTPYAGVYLMSCGAINGSIYLAGGHTDLTAATARNTVYKSTDHGATWTQLPNAPWAGRYCLDRMPAYKGKLWVVGGGKYDNNTANRVWYNDVWCLDPETDTWTEVLPNGVAPFEGRTYANVFVFDGWLYLSRGANASGNLSDTWRTLDGINWVRVDWDILPSSHADALGTTSDHVLIVSGNHYLVGSPGNADSPSFLVSRNNVGSEKSVVDTIVQFGQSQPKKSIYDGRIREGYTENTSPRKLLPGSNAKLAGFVSPNYDEGQPDKEVIGSYSTNGLTYIFIGGGLSLQNECAQELRVYLGPDNSLGTTYMKMNLVGSEFTENALGIGAPAPSQGLNLQATSIFAGADEANNNLRSANAAKAMTVSMPNYSNTGSIQVISGYSFSGGNVIYFGGGFNFTEAATQVEFWSAAAPGTSLGTRRARYNASSFTFDVNAVFNGLHFLGVYTVATLPAAASNAGAFAQVTDSSATTNGNTVAGGGANRVPVFSNGTNWIIK